MNTHEATAGHWQEILDVLLRWKPLGHGEASNGAKLIGHVPHRAPEAYLHTTYLPLNEDQIAQMEKKIGVRFPMALHDFFLCSNGLNIFSDALSIGGVRESYVRIGDAARQPYDLVDMNYPSERPRDARSSMVFFGGYNSDGSNLYFDAEAAHPEHIYRCSRESVVPLNQWSDFWTMLDREVRRLSSLFSATGAKIDPHRPTTP